MLIYKLTNIRNGKVYIGLTTRTLPCRLREHEREAAGKARMVIARAIRKHGMASFLVEELAQAETFEELLALEQKFIAEYRSNEHRLGYNRTSGGDGSTGAVRSEAFKEAARLRMTGFKMPLDARKRMSEIARARGTPTWAIEGNRKAWADPIKREAMTAQRRGRKWSDETRTKNITARKGKKRGRTAQTEKMERLMADECGTLHRKQTVKRGNKIVCWFCERRAEQRRIDKMWADREAKAIAHTMKYFDEQRRQLYVEDGRS